MARGRPRSTAGASTPGGALERIVFEIGQRLGEALLRGVKASAVRGGAVPRGPGRPRASLAGASCVVPSCTRRAVARGLCATHYRKARRLNMPDALNPAQLAELSQDGRKTRFGSGPT